MYHRPPAIAVGPVMLPTFDGELFLPSISKGRWKEHRVVEIIEDDSAVIRGHLRLPELGGNGFTKAGVRSLLVGSQYVGRFFAVRLYRLCFLHAPVVGERRTEDDESGTHPQGKRGTL